MLTFFRRIRKGLLGEGATSRYFLYAIGEIALVVIGILIALQINNWNENKKQLQKEVTHLIEIKRNLEENLADDIEPAIISIKKSIATYDSIQIILYDPKYNRDRDATIELLWSITNPADLVLNTVAFDNLISTGIDLISNDSLRTKIATLYGYEYERLIELDVAQHLFTREVIWPLIQDNINYLHTYLTDKEMKFLQSSGPFNSKLYGNNLDLKDIYQHLIRLKPTIEGIIVEIEDELVELE